MVLRERDSPYNPYLLCNSGGKWHMSYDVNRLPSALARTNPTPRQLPTKRSAEVANNDDVNVSM